jgi:hypothetical protein
VRRVARSGITARSGAGLRWVPERRAVPQLRIERGQQRGAIGVAVRRWRGGGLVHAAGHAAGAPEQHLVAQDVGQVLHGVTGDGVPVEMDQGVQRGEPLRTVPVEDGQGEEAQPVAPQQARLVGEWRQGGSTGQRGSPPTEQQRLRGPEAVVEAVEPVEQCGTVVRDAACTPVMVAQLGELVLPLVEQLFTPGGPAGPADGVDGHRDSSSVRCGWGAGDRVPVHSRGGRLSAHHRGVTEFRVGRRGGRRRCNPRPAHTVSAAHHRRAGGPGGWPWWLALVAGPGR